jgi:hypothetical protein
MRIALSRLGENKRVSIKVIIAIYASCFSTFHASTIGLNFINQKTATITTAQSVATGK